MHLVLFIYTNLAVDNANIFVLCCNHHIPHINDRVIVRFFLLPKKKNRKDKDTKEKWDI